MGNFVPDGPMTNDQLLSIIDDRKQLPEHLFVTNFLPVFAGTIPLHKVKDFMSVWISISGSPAAGVDIIDRSGNILYTVPPIFDSTFIDPSRKDGSMNFAEIVHFAKLHNGISPQLEQNVFIQNVQKKIDGMAKKSPTFAKNVMGWVEIFKRYNIGPAKKEENTPVVNGVSKTSNVTDDDFE